MIGNIQEREEHDGEAIGVGSSTAVTKHTGLHAVGGWIWWGELADLQAVSSSCTSFLNETGSQVINRVSTWEVKKKV